MAKRKIALLEAPSNLGLTPPEKDAPPGCYKAPWALRNAGIVQALRAREAGVVIPPRYHASWRAGDGDRNADAIADYSQRLADHVGALLDDGAFPVVVGGDCSILIGNMLALRRRGRHGLVFLDAHSDFRHPGNAKAIRAAAGEDLAIVTGRGDRRLINLERRRPYVRKEDAHVLGVRSNDLYLKELATSGIAVATSAQVRGMGGAAAADEALQTVTRATSGFWIHLDVDVIDASEMPAADCPEPDGLTTAMLADILRPLLRNPHCIGMEVTIYDPDLDPDGGAAERIVRCLRSAFSRA
ncbi:MAG TPA: arginase family protein [Chthoniobacterales bacterium]|nr:arginase family protein [Chthoniobacterales bacterium]